MNNIVVSTIYDNNIFHIFAFDIIKYYNVQKDKKFIVVIIVENV